MLLRRVLSTLALVLVIGSSPSVAAAPAGAVAGTLQLSAREPGAAAPRELHLVLRFSAAPDYLKLVAVADDWAAGHRVVLQHRTTNGWTKLARRRFSSEGRARWLVPVEQPTGSYRAVTRVDGERYVSPKVGFSQRSAPSARLARPRQPVR